MPQASDLWPALRSMRGWQRPSVPHGKRAMYPRRRYCVRVIQRRICCCYNLKVFAIRAALAWRSLYRIWIGWHRQR